MKVNFLLNFVKFSPEELDIIGAEFYEQSVAKNKLFLAEGEVCKKVAFMESGALILSQVLENGNEQVLDFFTEGSMISDYYSYLKNTQGNTRIRALTQSKLIVINKNAVQSLYDSIPNFQKLGRILAETSFLELAEKIKLEGLSPLERYKRLLSRKPGIFEEFPQYMIASYLGISPEWLSKIRSQK